MLGEITSIIVAANAVIRAYTKMFSHDNTCCVTGVNIPKNQNEPKDNKKADTNKANDPSRDLLLVHGNSIWCFPQRLPTTEASVSENIIINSPAKGK